MVDLSNFNTSIKTVWIKRLLEANGSWTTILKENLPNVDLEYFLNSNVLFKDLCFKFLKHFPFWGEVLQHWFNISYNTERLSYNEICNEQLWFNSNIKVNNKVVFYRKWYDNRIRTVSDLIINDNLMTYEEFEDIYGSDFTVMKFNSIISALPRIWKKVIKQSNYTHGNSEILDVKVDKFIQLFKPNKLVYRNLRLENSTNPTLVKKRWEKEFMLEINEDIWLENLYSILTYTKEVKFKSFIYNFNFRNVPTNTRLYNMGIKQSKNCYLCKKELESIQHLYVECETTKRLWERLKVDVFPKLCSPDKLSSNLWYVLFGEWDETNLNLRTIWISYHLLHFIHVCKCKEEIPTFEKFIGKLKYVERIERDISARKAKLGTHYVKWSWLLH